MGLGINASMAVDSRHEKDLAVIDGSALFPERITKLCWRKGVYQRGYVQEFINGFISGASLAHLNVLR